MIYFIWAVFARMAPFKPITMDDGWDQMNRSYMYVLSITLACFVDFGLISGQAIKCTGFEEVFTEEFAENYCWTQGIYTLAEAYDLPLSSPSGGAPWSGVPYPGILPEELPPCIPATRYDGVVVLCPEQDKPRPLTRVYHLWYQFVQLYFWVVSALFYAPYMLYVSLEIAYVKPIIKMLHNPLVDAHEYADREERAARWLRRRLDLYTDHRSSWVSWVRRYSLLVTVVGTKLLYLTFSIGILLATDRMFKLGSFVTYGVDWFVSASLNDTILTPPAERLFPRMAACEIKHWGATGIARTRGMCLLAQNVTNSYYFLFFWCCLVLTIAGNVFGLTLTLARHCVSVVGYARLATLTFSDSQFLRELYARVGPSGRVTLLQLAENIHPNTFYRLVRKYRWLKMYEHVEYNGHVKSE